MAKQPRTVGTKEGLGFGIIGLGILLAFIPSASQQIADLGTIKSSAFGISLGATYVIAFFVALAGLAVILMHFDEEDSGD